MLHLSLGFIFLPYIDQGDVPLYAENL